VIAERYLRMDWSPEHVSGFLRVEGIMRINHETIYIHVWADKRARGDLWRHLRQAKKRRRKRYSVPLMGAGHQPEHERADSPVPAEGPEHGPHHTG